MDIHVDSLPMAGKAFRFSVWEGVGNTSIEVYVDSKLVHAHDCDDPPCHEMAMVPPRTRGAILVASIAGLIGVVVAALLGKVIALAWLSARDKQDKKVEWRNHAIELTKLDLERKLRTRGNHDSRPLRPSVMDFLANYRDLQELGEKSPKELYLKIERDRITKPKNQDDSGKKGGGGKKKGAQIRQNRSLRRDWQIDQVLIVFS